MAPWTTLFWLMVAFLLLVVLNRWITAHVQGVGFLLSNNKTVAIWLYFFLFLPGILVHETSHYLMAILLRVQVDGFSLWPRLKGNNELILGSVEVRGADPLRHSLVGVAPLLLGSAVVLLIGNLLQFNLLAPTIRNGDLSQTTTALWQSMATPDFWLWLYLLFAVANAMLPSPADRIYWLPVFLFVSAVILLAIALNIMPVISTDLQEYGFAALAFMASALSIAVAVDLFFVVFIFVLEAVLITLTRRRVQY